MSVNTKLFVATANTNIIYIMPKVIKALNVYVRDLLDQEVKKQGYLNRMHFLVKEENRKSWSNGCELMSYNFESFSIYFRIGENRRVFVSNTCSSDYSDTYEGEKIIFDLNCWGKSDEIMQVIIPILKEFGRVFYDFNDSDDQDFIEQ